MSTYPNYRIERLAKVLIRKLVTLAFNSRVRDRQKLIETWQKARVIGVMCVAGIGDAVMATPLISEIRRCKPGAKVVVISTTTTSQIFKHNPDVNAICCYASRRKQIISYVRLLLKLRQEKIDVLFAAQPANTVRHSCIAAFSSAKLCLKHDFDYSALPERDFSFIYNALIPSSITRHRLELNLDLLRYLGEEIEERASCPRYDSSQLTDDRVESRLSNFLYDARNFVAIHPGGGMKKKHWSPQRFVELGKVLTDFGAFVLLVGGKEETTLCETISAQIGQRASSFAGKLNLEETAALLKRCSFLVSNDTGIMHLATAIGTPVFAIFGPTDPRHIGPYSDRATVIYKTNDLSDVEVIDVIGAILKSDFLSTEINVDSNLS